ncbi:MAG: 30S ribosomal protein S6--L-glutamate ligase [Spirochaetales bacterium]|nr:30S ribosomal protein S6--L-glutamate ligase [Spirochaetales bacterium]
MSRKKTVGRLESVTLPALSLTNIQAKIDTGADSSSLHCESLSFCKEDKSVQFTVETNDKELKTFTYPVSKMKWVKSSNGIKEYRFYIKTELEIRDQIYRIEVSLTDRSQMKYQMLIGRQFLHNKFLVDVSLAEHSEHEKIKIGILSMGENLYSTQRLFEAARQKGWDVEIINYLKCFTTIENNNLKIFYNGRELSGFDAIIPRIGASQTFFGTAVVRQFELMNVYPLNSSMSITRSRDKLRSQQIFAKHGIDMPKSVFASKVEDVDKIIDEVGGAPLIIKMIEGTQGMGVVLSETKKAAKSVLEAFYNLKVNLLVQEYIAEAGGADIRAFVVGGRVVAAIKRQGNEEDFRSNIHRGGSASGIKLTNEEKKLAIKAARVMGLEVAGVDMIQSKRGPLVLEVNSSPGLEGIEKYSGKDVAKAIMDYLETQIEQTFRKKDILGL